MSVVHQMGDLVIPVETYGDRLRRVRHRLARMDLGDFAESIGMSKTTYAGHEKRTTVPRNGQLVANSVELRWRVPADWIIGGDDNKRAWRDSNSQPSDPKSDTRRPVRRLMPVAA